MTAATRPNGFPNFTMGSSSSDKNTQPLAPFSAWSSNSISNGISNGIWANGSTIGGQRSSHRDTAGSRDSEEPSPSAPSGSAQLNPLSEAVPSASWAASRGGIWNQPATSSHRPSNSGNASPTRTRDGFSNNYPEMTTNGAHIFQPRHSINQNSATLQNRTVPPGPADPSLSSFKYGTSFVSEPVNEDKVSNLYGSLSASQLNIDPSGLYRRNSTDPAYLNLGPNRQGSLGARQAEADLTAPSSRYGENSHYPFGKMASHTKSQSQRPSLPNTSVALPSESTRPGAFAFGSTDASTHDLDDSFNRALNLDGNLEVVTNGFATSGLPDPASQPFQFNPGSQPWQHDLGSNVRGFGQGVQPDWTEPPNPSHYSSKRGSVERVSPAGSSYPPNFNSPKAYAGTPNPRGDPWSRPGSRDPRILQDLDRQQHGSQYLTQQPGYYPPPYYNSSVPQFPNPYDQYVQQSNYRSPMQVPGYGMPVNYVGGIPVPMRPSRDQDPGKGVRSMLLEEFRGSGKSTKRFELKDIYNYIVEFSGDQHGSRFIQEKLQTANSDEKDQVFREIEPNALQLMKDVFGNYVIQKFFEHGNQVQKKIIAAQMKGKVAELSMQMYACRVVQKALEHVLVEQQIEIVDELRPDIMRIVKDQNGNHVIQKIIQMVPRLCIPFIMDAFKSQIRALASHNYGCRVIQRILEHGTEAEKRELMADLHVCATDLISDQYGNYVTQHIISHGEPDDRSMIVRHVTDRVVMLSRHKFASNVVEKSIEFGTLEERRAIRNQLTALDKDGTSSLHVTMKDQFGNYVIQKLLYHLKGEDYNSFVEEMRPQLAILKKTSNGRQIAALERYLPASAQSAGRPGSTTHAATSPPTPSLRVEVNSAVPTPSLTMEQNSPESNSPPSTNISTLEDAVHERKDLKDSQLNNPARPAVQIDES